MDDMGVVIVSRLLREEREVTGTAGLVRRPRIGDQGAIVHVLGQEHRTVECVDSSGGTSWLADFHVTELVSALTLQLWHFDVREVSAGVYRASGKGPSGMSVDSTDADPDKAMSDCRAFALRYPE
jgi:hypothetical protein